MKSSLMYIFRGRGTISNACAHSEWYGRIQLRTIYILTFTIVCGTVSFLTMNIDTAYGV